ncbi:hypothetical protein [Tengunoibacter tsumagoiensis]|uniref:Lipoprotein LpqB beta-propeller domain-containing protein n=1 Tax=Tengunoibacter tsumagoiensis TaxID=2014871 RepID=A0A402A129_9CHLR|nr:hypothetical protein [Tengunoibacter tsumagoiensis]GCE12759.1 hypothetical protein KTT_26180 [Tengunoibacter tsumagoiensis]
MLLLLVSMSLAACKPGHLGSTILTFLRDGQLWTVDPDGANAFAIVSQGDPVIGYSWSPTHQILAYRTLDSSFAHTAKGKSLSHQSATGLIPDLPGTINTLGVDGGTPIPIAFSNASVRYSNAQWTPTGTRLIYRQSTVETTGNPLNNAWWISQNDQPGGIAVKSFPDSYSIPSLSYDDRTPRLVGNDEQGIFTTTLAGTERQALTHEALAGHPLIASLERILWRPHHQNQSYLYALPDSGSSSHSIHLILADLTGQTTVIADCTCEQFSWSPDGKAVLYRSDSTYTFVTIPETLTGHDLMSFSFSGEKEAAVYWSPDSHFLLLDGPHTLTVMNLSNHQQKIVVSDTADATTTGGAQTAQITVQTLLQPATNNLWASDSRHLAFLTNGRTKTLAKGLYTLTVDAQGSPQDPPTLVDKGNDTQVGWSYQDPNTSFLY